jgi:cellulose synthase/poly-beta-1,6-N-acetylglucosamine synthase-like glycosyltransferase
MEILFWASAALIFYVYIGYPLALAGWARLITAARAARTRRTEDDAHFATAVGESSIDSWAGYAVAHDQTDSPGVSVIVAIRNEAHRVRARVENLLAQDYDADVEIIVASDGSDDDPAAALHGCSGAVRLLTLPGRGKAAALNAGVAAARHDILVFADARQRFAPDALRQLVAPFANPAVGGVSGELLLDAEEDPTDTDSASVAEGVTMYWRYEKTLRRLESAVGSTLGATGAIYALRRSLWQPLPVDTILDDVLAPMRAVLAGYRVVFEERAKAFDAASRDAAAESRRKVRTLAGNVQILWLEPRLLIPVLNPVWFQYVSHKLGRLVVPYALLAVFVSSLVLATRHWVFGVALVAQLGFYLLAAYGAYLARPVLGANHVQDA